MAFTLAGLGQKAFSAVYNEIAAYFNGSASAGSNPIKLITLNDAVNPVLTLKNLDTTTGLVLDADKADGTNLVLVDKNGFRYSPDGVLSGLTPASLSGTETFTGAKTFSAATAFNSKVTNKVATSTASASALTLPTDGNIVPITGVQTINSIVATGLAGLDVTLMFASAGCTVKAAALLGAQGDYISTAGGMLRIACDSTPAWHEVGRAGYSIPGARYYISGATQEIASGAMRTVSWTEDDWRYGLTAPTTSAPVPGILGRWAVKGSVVYDWSEDHSSSRGFLLKNGSVISVLWGIHTKENAGDYDGGMPFATEFECTSITDTYGLGVREGSTHDLLGGVTKTHMIFTYLGR